MHLLLLSIEKLGNNVWINIFNINLLFLKKLNNLLKLIFCNLILLLLLLMIIVFLLLNNLMLNLLTNNVSSHVLLRYHTLFI